MKKLAICGAVLFLAALAGCIRIEPPEPALRLLSAVGVIYPPLANGMPMHYDANVQPGDKVILDFGTGRDQYGNKVGLSDDTRWTVREVRIQCSAKAVEDTVFWPTNLGENECVWFPAWTAPEEPISGLPLPPYPLDGYPFDSCLDRGCDPLPAQVATIGVSAEADWIIVEVVFDEVGDHEILWPGELIVERVTGDRASHRIGQPGEILVDGDPTDIPVAWFWCDAEFQVNVAPTGVM